MALIPLDGRDLTSTEGPYLWRRLVTLFVVLLVGSLLGAIVMTAGISERLVLPCLAIVSVMLPSLLFRSRERVARARATTEWLTLEAVWRKEQHALLDQNEELRSALEVARKQMAELAKQCAEEAARHEFARNELEQWAALAEDLAAKVDAVKKASERAAVGDELVRRLEEFIARTRRLG